MNFQTLIMMEIKIFFSVILEMCLERICYCTTRKPKILKQSRTFQIILNQLNIEGTKCYYSYHRSGCADKNWDSDLFFIENFKTFKLGTISGRECENRDEKDGIYIYKSKENKETLTETRDINEIHKFQNDKWDYIKEYWTNNYKKFE
jgi:hypothetical protein